MPRAAKLSSDLAGPFPGHVAQTRLTNTHAHTHTHPRAIASSIRCILSPTTSTALACAQRWHAPSSFMRVLRGLAGSPNMRRFKDPVAQLHVGGVDGACKRLPVGQPSLDDGPQGRIEAMWTGAHTRCLALPLELNSAALPLRSIGHFLGQWCVWRICLVRVESAVSLVREGESVVDRQPRVRCPSCLARHRRRRWLSIWRWRCDVVDLSSAAPILDVPRPLARPVDARIVDRVELGPSS